MWKKRFFKEWIEPLIVALIIALFIRTFFVQAFKIPSGSMYPTLQQGDRILVNKFIYGAKIPFTKFRLPKIRSARRGDVIVFVYPLDKKRDFIKRLIAFGGETVKIVNGDVYVNDVLVVEPQIKNIYYYNRGPYVVPGGSIKVPKGNLFVLGDNSVSSRDSRFWGFVPEENLIGRAFFIYWPFSRMGIIK